MGSRAAAPPLRFGEGAGGWGEDATPPPNPLPEAERGDRQSIEFLRAVEAPPPLGTTLFRLPMLTYRYALPRTKLHEMRSDLGQENAELFDLLTREGGGRNGELAEVARWRR